MHIQYCEEGEHLFMVFVTSSEWSCEFFSSINQKSDFETIEGFSTIGRFFIHLFHLRRKQKLFIAAQ